MPGTYAAALFVIGASVPIGAAVLWLSGRREWSWLAPALGLAVMTFAAWLLVRLPGEGLTTLIVLAVAALLSCAALPRVGFGRAELAAGAPVALIALLVVSIPFAAEGHFGVLGTGFNVDMSQHLFTASWIADPIGRDPALINQGYPVGPHSLAVAGAEFSDGNLVYGFSGVTIAVPVVAALTALAATRDLGPRRAVVAAVLVAVPYLVASYVAQGAFKEVFEATFLLAFTIWLWELGRRGAEGIGFALPGAALVAGALYSYSGPGLAWLIGVTGIWALFGLARSPSAAVAAVRRAVPALAIALVALAVVVAPEASRIIDFGGNAGTVANARDAEPGAATDPAPLFAAAGDSDAEAPAFGDEVIKGGKDDETKSPKKLDLFDNDLGNLFGNIPALEVFGVWPSGDFRVEPGDGAIPAPVFYLGGLLGLLALGVGVRRALRERDDALLAGLIAAAVIWFAALLISTPYTTAKALQMVAPLLMLVALRGCLQESFSPLRPRPALGTALAAAFVLAAAGSSALALANAPVGPERYTPGIAKLRPQLTDVPVLLLAPPGQLSERHGADFYGWELRGGSPICVEAFPSEGTGYGVRTPDGIRYVITVGAKTEPPFTDLEEVSRRNRVTLWEAPDFDPAAASRIEIDPARPADCRLGLPVAS